MPDAFVQQGIYINKIWFVAFFAFVMLVSVTHVIYMGIAQIERDTEETHQRIDELMYGEH